MKFIFVFTTHFAFNQHTKQLNLESFFLYKTGFQPVSSNTEEVQDAITRSVHCKFDCITVNFDWKGHFNCHQLSLIIFPTFFFIFRPSKY